MEDRKRKSKNVESMPFYSVYGAKTYSSLELLYLYNTVLNRGPSNATSIWLPVKATSQHVAAACRRCSGKTPIAVNDLIEITLEFAACKNTDEVLIVIDDEELSMYNNHSDDRPRFSSWFRKVLLDKEKHAYIFH